jgi:hypothetical protein
VAYVRSLEAEAGKRGDVTQQEDEKRRAWFQIAHGGGAAREAQALGNRTIQEKCVHHALPQPVECRCSDLKCRAYVRQLAVGSTHHRQILEDRKQ